MRPTPIRPFIIRPFMILSRFASLVPLLLFLTAFAWGGSVFQWLQQQHFSQSDLALQQAQRLAVQQCLTHASRQTCHLQLVSMDAPAARTGKWHFQFQAATAQPLDIWVPESKQISL